MQGSDEGRHDRLWLVLPWLLLAAVAGAEVLRQLVSQGVPRPGALLSPAPAIAAIRGRPRMVLAVSVVATGIAVVRVFVRQAGTVDQYLTSLGAVLLVSIVSFAASTARQRSQARLTQVRRVSEAAQLALLRPMPRRMGELRLAARYVAAESEARIGGDLYEAVVGPRHTRLIIGDVRGKGLPAVRAAGAVLGAFREAARYETDLSRIAARCSESVSLLVQSTIEGAERSGSDSEGDGGSGGGPDGATEDADGPWAEWGTDVVQPVPDAAELFVTAIVVEFDGQWLRMINLGHPPPLLMTSRTADYIQAEDPLPPLGLAHQLLDELPVHAHPWQRGDRLLLYTDGIVEARDANGQFFPLLPCVDALLGVRTSALPDQLLWAVSQHTGGELGDDAAIVAVEWCLAQSATAGTGGTRG